MARKHGFFSRPYVFVQRYRQILVALLKYGFDDLASNLNLEQYLGWRIMTSKRVSRMANLSSAARTRLVLEELGPTFIKIGQALSTRSDLLPDDVLAELALLQDQVPPFENARAVIEKELGDDVSSIFSEFHDEPLAAGSIGQVHKARLYSGEEVAVKVQRPHIRKTITVDLEIIHNMATLVERTMDWGLHKPSRVVEELERTLMHELDYDIEASNMERFESLFEGHADVHVPRCYRDLSTSKMMVIELVDGIKPDNLDKLQAAGRDPKVIAKKGANLIIKSVFEYGFYHADPHPGNVLVLENNTICFLDFGMVGRLDRQSREIFADLLINVVQHNETKAVDALLKLTHSHALVDRISLEREIAELIDHHLYRPLKELEVGKLVRRLLDVTIKHELSIPPHFFLLLKTISQIEDLGRSLDPNFDFSSQAGPYIRKIIVNRYSPKRITRDIYETGSDLVYLFKEVPGEIRELLKQAKRGKVRIELEHLGLRPLLATVEKASNRVSSAIVLAAMIVGSSLIVLSGIPPQWNNIPIIGLGGFLASGIMGAMLLRAMWKAGR